MASRWAGPILPQKEVRLFKKHSCTQKTGSKKEDTHQTPSKQTHNLTITNRLKATNLQGNRFFHQASTDVVNQGWWEVKQWMSCVDHTDRNGAPLQNTPKLTPNLEVGLLGEVSGGPGGGPGGDVHLPVMVMVIHL